jgi:hydroxyethylthiazole kinase-like uncharacterized protein yjeF
MQKVLTAAEMREVDRATTERYGVPSIILMENAAHAVARVTTQKLGGSVKGRSILILCGRGNNGGDGAAVARLLSDAGGRVAVVLFGRVGDTGGDARVNFEIVEALSKTEADSDQPHIVVFEVVTDDDWEKLRHQHSALIQPDLVIDAMFGTGLTKPLAGIFATVVEWIAGLGGDTKENRPIVLSIDIPSGLNADSSQPIGPHVTADTTVTFTSPKPANALPPAAGSNGDLVVTQIGSPQILIDKQPSQLYVAERGDVTKWFRKTEFSNDSYKNKRGHALIVAGSENYSGAAVLCGNSAIRSGVGLVTVATPHSSKDSIAGRVVPEVMVRPLTETDSGSVSEDAVPQIEEFLENIDAIAIGAGLSAGNDSTGKFVRHFAENRKVPTILDADALTLLSPFASLGHSGGAAPPLIVTPHEGEFMRMLGTDDKNAIKDRVGAVRKFAGEHNVILVLKGERVLIGEPGGKVVVNPTGNAGLGKAGNGDTLLGVITGFVAQAVQMDIDIFESVTAACYVSGMAGDIAEEKFGKRVMTASDVRDCLADVFAELEK